MSSDPGHTIARFSTDAVPTADRADAWRAATCLTYVTERWRDEPLVGSLSSAPVGSLLFGRTTFGPQRYRRTPALVAESGLGHYLVQRFDHGRLLLDDGTVVEPGDIVLLDLGRAFAAHTEGGATTSVIIPRTDIDRAAGGRSRHGSVIRRNDVMNPPTAHYLESLSVLAERGRLVSEDVEQSLAAVLSAALYGTPAPTRTMESSLRTRIDLYIETHLADSLMSPESLARDFAVSRATLYRLYEDSGGVAAHLRKQRVTKALELLTTTDETIASVADACGLSTARTMERAFRDHLAMSPSEARRVRGRPAGSVRMLHEHFSLVGTQYAPWAASGTARSTPAGRPSLRPGRPEDRSPAAR